MKIYFAFLSRTHCSQSHLCIIHCSCILKSTTRRHIQGGSADSSKQWIVCHCAVFTYFCKACKQVIKLFGDHTFLNLSVSSSTSFLLFTNSFSWKEVNNSEIYWHHLITTMQNCYYHEFHNNYKRRINNRRVPFRHSAEEYIQN